MLYREDPAGIIVIGQPAHAWIAGQLAWGNEHVGTVAPWEEVCLTVEQHDMAYALWERAPTLNPQTGRPYSFLDMPTNIPANSSQELGREQGVARSCATSPLPVAQSYQHARGSLRQGRYLAGPSLQSWPWRPLQCGRQLRAAASTASQ
jgi:Protein of unknown function (DUF3891)